MGSTISQLNRMQKNVRQLAAIMFTDMVGYTALMQKNENKAIKNRKRHRKVLEDSIQKHNGTIVQYYGDGTLSVFDSAIEATKCAVLIQQELQKEPKIPLRIGMHVGDIVHSDDGIYGDAVNVASRIEKLSVPGGVLISDRVYEEIKNHQEFCTIPLGEFELKNVEIPLELFAVNNEGLQVLEKKENKSPKLEVEPNIKEIQQPLLYTKLYIPQLRSNLVPRLDLIEILNKGISNKLTLISAPAGFGKTTLISEWIAQIKEPVAWLSLDEDDNDPIRFFRYLIAALQNIESTISEAILTLFQSPQPPSIESVLANLIKEITDIQNDFILVLDDYHSLDEKNIHKSIEFLLDHMPTKMHIVITTRVDPPIPLSRLRVRNQLTELRAIDLSFSHYETVAFFDKVMSLELSVEEIDILETRTEGWVAGLQLAALSMQTRKDIPKFIKTFAGDDRHIVDYLAEEVLNHQPEYIQKFLLQTSILNRLSEPLCDFVTQKKGSQNILDELEKANLFIIPLDNKREWYRYHHLFADLLRQQLYQTQSDLSDVLHSRASVWYENNRLKDEAVVHALEAQDFERAANLMSEFEDIAHEYGRHFIMLNWFKILPIEIIRKNPTLCFSYGWILFWFGDYNEAKENLQAAEQLIDSTSNGVVKSIAPESAKIPITNNDELKFKIAVVRGMIAFYSGNLSDMQKYSTQVNKYKSSNNSIWRVLAVMTSGDAHNINGDMAAASQAYSEALNVSEKSGEFFLHFYSSVKLAETKNEQGDLRGSAEICKRLLRFVKEKGFEHGSIMGSIYLLLGENFRELNLLDDALNYIKKGSEYFEQSSERIMLGMSKIFLIKFFFTKLDLVNAKDMILRIEEITRKSEILPSMTELLEIYKIRILLKENKLNSAQQWMQENEKGIKGKYIYKNEWKQILFARINLAQGECDETLEILQELIKRAEKSGRILKVIEMLLVQSLAYQAKGYTAEALVALKKALKLSEPGGYISIFVDEGTSIAELIEKLLDADDANPKDYIKKLISAFRLSRLVIIDDGLEHLSEREAEVLRLISAGLSNKKIMEELFVSLSTVKTHVRNIYSKLNVHSRTEVIVKAKELNLL